MDAAGQWAQLCVGPQWGGALGSRQEARSVLGLECRFQRARKEAPTKVASFSLASGPPGPLLADFPGATARQACPLLPALGGPGTLPGQGPNPPYGACLPPSGYYVEVLLLKLEYTNICKNKVYIM